MSNQTKHTPGPWQINWSYHSRSAEIETVTQEDDKYRHLTNNLPMCAGPNCEAVWITDPETGDEYKYSAEAVANARLIAAAPELLEAAKRALAVLYALKDGAGARVDLRAAIAKAEGR